MDDCCEYSCGQAKTLNLPKPRKNPFNIKAWTQFIDLYERNFDIWTFGKKVVKKFGAWEKRR